MISLILGWTFSFANALVMNLDIGVQIILIVGIITAFAVECYEKAKLNIRLEKIEKRLDELEKKKDDSQK